MAEELTGPERMIGSPAKLKDLVDAMAVDVSDLSLSGGVLFFAGLSVVVEELRLFLDLTGIALGIDDLLCSAVAAIVEIISDEVARGFVEDPDQTILSVINE